MKNSVLQHILPYFAGAVNRFTAEYRISLEKPEQTALFSDRVPDMLLTSAIFRDIMISDNKKRTENDVSGESISSAERGGNYENCDPWNSG
ncbi:MAG: hypothetical protein IK130_06275 [Oscillospiraceae bacterium]|nr:hypothetical protein [Oscillospiraceae bacterium]